MSCELFLTHLAIAAGTYFWLWYLTYEGSVVKGQRRRTKWWERDIWPRKKDGR